MARLFYSVIMYNPYVSKHTIYLILVENGKFIKLRLTNTLSLTW